MRDTLVYPIKRFSLLYAHFLFFDTPSYLADQLFIRHEVRVWFGAEYAKEDSPYVAIFCRVRKRDTGRFLEALKDLKKSMLICGYTDYEDTVSRFLDRVERQKGVVNRCENDTARQAEQGQPA